MFEQNNTVPQEQEKLNQQKTDLQFYAQSWIWRAIEALVTAKNFNPSPIIIAKRINISVETVINALEGLERLNLIKRTESSYIKVDNMTIIDQTKVTKKDLLVTHSTLAPQILGMLDENSVFTSQIALGSLKIARKHAHKLIEFLDAVDADGAKEENPDLIAIEISIGQIGNNQERGLQ